MQKYIGFFLYLTVQTQMITPEQQQTVETQCRFLQVKVELHFHVGYDP